MSRKETNALAVRVARHFSAPEWFTTFEFPLWSYATEDGHDRQLDALAVSRVAGRGNELVGIEIKSDRADWLKELATPQKAESWIRLLDRFYLVAGKDVALVDEVPQTWGFLEESGSGLRVVRRAPVLEATKILRQSGGEPVPREMWVRIIRRTAESEGRDPEVDAAYSRGYETGKKEALELPREENRDRDYKLRELSDTVKAFEKASGLSLATFGEHPDGRRFVSPVGSWRAERLGAAVKVVLEHSDVVRVFGNHLESFERNAKDLREALEAAGWKAEE